MIESRIESDLSGTPVSSQSRIEQILNGETVVPKSRIEELLIGYNPEDPGDYHKVECTKAQYEAMSSHDSSTIYVVTYPDESVHFYLGDNEISGSTPTLIEKTITINGIYDPADESADGYSIVDVEVPEATLTTKSITENGTYLASTDNVDGYSSVTVEVSSSGGGPVTDGFFSSYNGYPRPTITLDLTKPFEIVICFKTTKPSSSKYMFGDYSIELGSLIIILFSDGRIAVALPYNNHTWNEAVTAFIPDTSVVNFNGTTMNYVKVERTSDGYLKISASTDGKTYTEYESNEIPSGALNISDAASFIFGNSGSYGPTAVSAETFNLFNSCMKSEGTLVWGREV